jgi:DNA polymerase-3 subunit epsilon
VRSYFGSDDRRMILPLLRAAQRIDHVPLPHPLVAQVLEVRELHRWRPRFNRRGARPQAAAYVHLTDEPFPRLRVVRRPGRTGVHLGPLPSAASAARVVEAVQQVLPLRRCTLDLRRGEPVRDTPCLPAQLGVSACPCAGAVEVEGYARAVGAAATVLGGDGGPVVGGLEERVVRLAGQRRFEEAALARDRLAALSAALDRAARISELISAGWQVIELAPGLSAHIDGGRLMLVDGVADGVLGPPPEPPIGVEPPTPAFADEAMVISRWLSRAATALTRSAAA